MKRIPDTNRISFSKIQNPLEYPDFLEVQLKSFKEFFQLETPPEQRKKEGLFKVFNENFPIKDTRNNFVLEFVDYSIDPPKFSIDECIARGLTYSVPLRAKVKLYCTDPEHTDFATVGKDVFLGNIPYMTESGTFVINGAERVVVSQFHRSPGVFFSTSLHTSGIKLYSARIIPFRGSWIEFSTDPGDVLYAYLDRKKKIPVTMLLRAMGYATDKEILTLFDIAEEVKVSKSELKRFYGRALAERVYRTYTEDIQTDATTGEVTQMPRSEIVFERGTELSEEVAAKLIELGYNTILLKKQFQEGEKSVASDIIFATLENDNAINDIDAWNYIFHLQRGIQPADDNTAKEAFNNLFFSEKRYDLGEVGRYRINKKLNLSIDPAQRVLTQEDVVGIIKYIIELVASRTNIDDIDHLSNRRIRTVGEQLYTQFGIALSRMARTVRERMNVRDGEVFTPEALMNSKTIPGVMNSFFGTDQLSQFMDQTNPLAEVTHKRRISALGKGGLTRDRAGFEVRDVHYTHYGRLCPIETPEGPNIGLISSLCVYAKVSDMGFIETPYRAVKNGKVDFSDKGLRYYSAEEEEDKYVAQGNAPLNEKGEFILDRVKSRYGADFPVIAPSQVDLMDVSPSQIASIAASLIPFLEHDDANRALMGSNMMRQAVPLLRPEAPIVGTGIEAKLVRDSRTQIVAEGDGEVIYADAETIKVRYDKTEKELFVSFDPPIKVYKLPKFRKTNQSTTIDLKPICKEGQRVSKGQILTEGYATQKGELALGRNILAAYMPWKGYNYEDAIVLNERMVREDIFTSVHVDEYELEVRETKRGMEELTGDIPNVSEEATKELGADGIIRIGAHVVPGDILVGKITPKGETDPTPEEKLLRAIFGEKAGDVKDASLKASPSLRGVVIDTKLFSRADVGMSRKEQKSLTQRFEDELEAKKKEIDAIFLEKLLKLVNKKSTNRIVNYIGEELVKKGTPLSEKALEHVVFTEVANSDWTDDPETNEMVGMLLANYLRKVKETEADYRRRQLDEVIGDELPTGTMKKAKVYIAKKRKIQVGDKMAGRHGNKGIVSKIVRQEDMPFLEDGTPVDICLNPLGVPSRMNLGQLFEAILAWSGRKQGVKYATHIFDGASLEDIQNETKKAGLPMNGRTQLYDGGTGEPFDQPATVGVTYFLKLGHMVDDKMHARSIGPYSLITQQPLGGKAQFGGQRFGEMEVWALEAFGAAHILQEMLTVKSDDMSGRSKVYEAIVKGTPMPEPGIPESLNVLFNELKGLGLSLTLE